MTAAATLAHWADLCRTSTRADNAIRVAGTLYCVTVTATLANGAITGRVYAHDASYGMRDIGAFKIAADGQVLSIPEPLRDVLIAALPEPAYYVCSDEASEVPL